MSGHHHHHGHGHDHGGIPQTQDHRRRLLVVVALTGVIVVAQLVGSILTGSLALLTDTAHAITDFSGLLVALIAATLMLRPADATRTWGFRRIEVIAALAQATLLLAVGVYAAIEGVQRLFAPPEVPSTELLIFGVIGLAANLIGIAVLQGGRDANFNMRAAFLEVVNDALGSVGVIVAAIVIALTGFQQADALAGLFIVALIVPRAIGIIKDTTRVLMEYAPEGLDLGEVRRHIEEVDHVVAVHDLHASTIATGLPVLTAHVVTSDECFRDGHVLRILTDIKSCVAEHFDVSVQHSTFQLESETFNREQGAGIDHSCDPAH
ncbi:cation diffusion facilitator family transporter [Tessaracoccus caeni]|uniref:cation diffusion facilitator family transporter n=1 Tax=Tessaracoccus caeni TaxID=3031239 RepID=UPI0023DB3F0D|nr:cation diffusion facilitator family transporter [Tessaracoccus caeni]MDF1489079.1 cation diffusion facilitator family transporter [Tessaracoccus caeni]